MAIKSIAFYLPQFHPIPENDAWWGKGFTEWTNVTKAKPLFKGHYQPNLPADLGFYDLRLEESRLAQEELAQKYGITAFCYWHYWFGKGKRILERPLNDKLKSKDADMSFCLAWANESWSGIWHGCPKKILLEQTYPGKQDYIDHFYHMLPAFKDKRAFKVNGKIVFVVYRPYDLPDPNLFIKLWQGLAKKEGLEGFHFVGYNNNTHDNPKDIGFDAFVLTFETKMRRIKPPSKLRKLKAKIFKFPLYKYDYEEASKHFIVKEQLPFLYYPCVLPNWDNSPRSNLNGTILHNSTPNKFGKVLNEAVYCVKEREEDKKVIFIKSWNEWAESNYLEPDRRWGHRYLETFRNALIRS